MCVFIRGHGSAVVNLSLARVQLYKLQTRRCVMLFIIVARDLNRMSNFEGDKKIARVFFRKMIKHADGSVFRSKNRKNSAYHINTSDSSSPMRLLSLAMDIACKR